MLRLPKPNKELKLPKAYAFITNHGDSNRLLTCFTNSLSWVKTNAYQFDTDLLKEPVKESSGLFAWVTGQESIVYVPWYIFFVLSSTLGWIGVLIGPKSFRMRLYTNCWLISKERSFSWYHTWYMWWFKILLCRNWQSKEILISLRNPYKFGTWCCGSTKSHSWLLISSRSNSWFAYGKM